MYYIDSPTRNVDAFDFDAATGSICNRRHVVTFQKADGIPDGMCVDAEGMLWIAQWGGGQVSRWDPRTARMIDRILVPVPNVTCCAFAGEHRDEMYITTSTVGITKNSRGDYPHAGALFMLRPGTQGAAVHRSRAEGSRAWWRGLRQLFRLWGPAGAAGDRSSSRSHDRHSRGPLKAAVRKGGAGTECGPRKLINRSNENWLKSRQGKRRKG